MPMEEEDDQFDSTLLEAAMSLAASKGWGSLSMPEIARHAGLDVGEVRCRYPFKTSVLLLLGQLADRSALIDDGSLGTSREMLFDLMMRRFDVFQQYRPGVLSVLKTLPFDPLVTIILGGATVDSMRWIAGAAGIQTSGIEGALRVQGVVALWTYALRSWEKDDSEDLGLTMIALESGLDRAERMGLFRNAVALKSETGGDETSNLLTSEAGDASFNDFQDGK